MLKHNTIQLVVKLKSPLAVNRFDQEQLKNN